MKNESATISEAINSVVVLYKENLAVSDSEEIF
jgi:hypothetical protein